MADSSKKLCSLYLLVSLLAFVLLSPNQNYVQCIVWSHFPPLVINSLFLILTFGKVCTLQTMHDLIVPRIEYKNFALYVFKIVLRDAFLYLLVFYLGLYIYRPLIPEGYFMKILLFMGIHSLCVFLETLILYLQLFYKKNYLFLVLAIAIHLAFHYLLVINLFV